MSRKAIATSKSHARCVKRTRMDSKASKILAQAVVTKPEAIIDDEGNVIRIWKDGEDCHYTHDDIKLVLSNTIAVEEPEMLGTIRPRAIKYCVSKGWLHPNSCRSLFFVTKKAGYDLGLPRFFLGGRHHGNRIRWAF